MSPLRPAALAMHARHCDGAAADNPEVLPTVPSDTSRSVTELLDAWGRGDRAALDALVHEAYVRLAGQPGAGANNRSHFFALAAMVMRSVLVDHARARHAAKRGGARAWLRRALTAT